MSMITAFTSTTPSTITSIGHRLTACCQLMEIRSQGDPAPWFFLTNEEDPGHHFFLKAHFRHFPFGVCVNASWIVYGNFFYAQHPFLERLDFSQFVCFLEFSPYVFFESWLNELTDRDLPAWQQMASCIFSPLPRHSRTRSRGKMRPEMNRSCM